MCKSPLAALDFILFRAGKLQKVAKGIADDVFIAFVIVAVFLHSPDHTGDVRGNRGLFRNNECFHVNDSGPKAPAEKRTAAHRLPGSFLALLTAFFGAAPFFRISTFAAA